MKKLLRKAGGVFVTGALACGLSVMGAPGAGAYTMVEDPDGTTVINGSGWENAQGMFTSGDMSTEDLRALFMPDYPYQPFYLDLQNISYSSPVVFEAYQDETVFVSLLANDTCELYFDEGRSGGHLYGGSMAGDNVTVNMSEDRQHGGSGDCTYEIVPNDSSFLGREKFSFSSALSGGLGHPEVYSKMDFYIDYIPRPEIQIDVFKVDPNSSPLEGASFAIYPVSDGVVDLTATPIPVTWVDGNRYTTTVPQLGDYAVVETEPAQGSSLLAAPAVFSVSKPGDFIMLESSDAALTVADQTNAETNARVTVTNVSNNVARLPETGSTTLIWLGLLVLISVAGAVAAQRFNKK